MKKPNCHRPRSSAPRRAFRPRLEPLEDRLAPATFTVTHLGDAGSGSLRQAILDANDRDGDDVIDFAPSVTGTINLLGELPELNSNIDLRGPGADRLTVRRSTGDAYRIFTID